MPRGTFALLVVFARVQPQRADASSAGDPQQRSVPPPVDDAEYDAVLQEHSGEHSTKVPSVLTVEGAVHEFLSHHNEAMGPTFEHFDQYLLHQLVEAVHATSGNTATVLSDLQMSARDTVLPMPHPGNPSQAVMSKGAFLQWWELANAAAPGGKSAPPRGTPPLSQQAPGVVGMKGPLGTFSPPLPPPPPAAPVPLRSLPPPVDAARFSASPLQPAAFPPAMSLDEATRPSSDATDGMAPSSDEAPAASEQLAGLREEDLKIVAAE